MAKFTVEEGKGVVKVEDQGDMAINNVQYAVSARPDKPGYKRLTLDLACEQEQFDDPPMSVSICVQLELTEQDWARLSNLWRGTAMPEQAQAPPAPQPFSDVPPRPPADFVGLGDDEPDYNRE